MNKIVKTSVAFILIVFVVNSVSMAVVQAGTKAMTATKRDKFKDDEAESMRDVFDRREAQDKAYKATMLANSDQTVQLLKEIKVLLEQLNQKE